MSKKILIADDDEAIREALEIMLEEEGYTVQSAVSVDEVLNVQAPYPDLILLDLSLANLNDKNICQLLRDDQNTQKTKIIIFSANQDTESISKKLGADDFITKPFEMIDLLEKVASHLT